MCLVLHVVPDNTRISETYNYRKDVGTNTETKGSPQVETERRFNFSEENNIFLVLTTGSDVWGVLKKKKDRCPGAERKWDLRNRKGTALLMEVPGNSLNISFTSSARVFYVHNSDVYTEIYIFLPMYMKRNLETLYVAGT